MSARRFGRFGMQGVMWFAAESAGFICLAGMPGRVLASQAVNLTWNASSSADVAAYKVYFGTESGVYPNSIIVADVSGAAISGLAAGVSYYFAVAAIDGNNDESGLSNEAVYSVPVPSSIELQAQATSLTPGSVELFWTPSGDSDVFAYVLEYGAQSGIYTNAVTYYDTTDVIVSGLAGGTTYYFAVSPVDAYGVAPVASNEVAITAPAAQPIVLQAQMPAASAGVALSWNAPAGGEVASYNIYYGTGSGLYTDSLNCGDVTADTVQGLAAGQTYYFVVTAVDAGGQESPCSNEASALAPYPAPAVLQVQTCTDENGQPYLLHVTSGSTVYGAWELDGSTDLQNWSPYTYGYGSGNGDGGDVNAYISIDPAQPQMFFRLQQ